MANRGTDLISREEVLQKLESVRKKGKVNLWTITSLIWWVRLSAKRTYDVAGVIKALERRRDYYKRLLDEDVENGRSHMGYERDIKSYNDAIEIVKSGWSNHKKES